MITTLIILLFVGTIGFLLFQCDEVTINSKLRIIEKTNIDVGVYYSIQKNILWIFWIDASEFMGKYTRSLKFRTYYEANEFIMNHKLIKEKNFNKSKGINGDI